MITEWYECDDDYELGQMLVKQGKFSTALWRQFHCHCCRSVWKFIAEKPRFAITQAECVVANEISASELAILHQEMIHEADRTWSQVNALRIPSESDDAIWPLSDDVDDAWCS